VPTGPGQLIAEGLVLPIQMLDFIVCGVVKSCGLDTTTEVVSIEEYGSSCFLIELRSDAAVGVLRNYMATSLTGTHLTCASQRRRSLWLIVADVSIRNKNHALKPEPGHPRIRWRQLSWPTRDANSGFRLFASSASSIDFSLAASLSTRNAPTAPLAHAAALADAAAADASLSSFVFAGASVGCARIPTDLASALRTQSICVCAAPLLMLTLQLPFAGQRAGHAALSHQEQGHCYPALRHHYRPRNQQGQRGPR